MNFIKNINWHDFITSKFWFELDSLQIHPSEKAFLYIGGVLVVLGILFLLFARFASNKFLARAAVRFSKIFFLTGFLEMFWYLLRFEYVQVLGSKFVAALILLLGLIYLIGPFKYLFRNYKEDMVKSEREANRAKYLNRK